MSDLVSISNDDVGFLPSPYQQELKARFWARAELGPLRDPKTIVLEDVKRVVDDPVISRYWKLPGFQSWFVNENEAVEKIDYLTMLGLQALEAVLLDQKAQASAKVNAVKLLAEMKGLLQRGGNQQPKQVGSPVSQMGPDELKAFLEKNGVKRG